MKNLIAYTELRIQTLNRILATKPAAYHTETFHTLRVEIKKIRFILDLLSHADQDFREDTAMQQLRKIFRKAGQVRDHHIQNKTLEPFAKHPQFAAFRHILEKSLQKRKAGFFRFMHAMNKKTLQKKLQELLFSMGAIRKTDLATYHHEQEKKIAGCLRHPSFSIEEMHALRKLFKKLTYAGKLVSQKQHLQNTKTAQLSELIGQWHDSVVTRKKLKKIFRGKKMDAKEHLLLKKILATLQSSSNTYYTRLTTRMQKIDFVPGS